MRALNWLSFVCFASFSERIPVTSQYIVRSPTANSPSKPPDRYQVSTSWLKMRGPASSGRLVKNGALAVPVVAPLPSRSIPNGLKGWFAGMKKLTMYGVEPPSTPKNNGTGAARPCDWRLVKLASPTNLTLSLMSYSPLVNRLKRSFGVTRWLNGW